MSRGGSSRSGGYARSGYNRGSYGGRYYGGYRGGRYYGGRGYSSFYFSPYGFGYGYGPYGGYYGRGWNFYLGGLGYGYYDNYYGPGYGYAGYSSPSYYPSEYVDTSSDDDYVVSDSTASPIIAAAGAAAEYQLQAEQAFRAHNYEEAVRLSNHAIVEDMGNGRLHLFAVQALFAVGDYRGAAGALQQGLSLLQPSDWGYVVENYKLFYEGNDYLTQMESLVAYNKQNPSAAYAHLVRGYQYVFLGYKEAAEKQLSTVVALESRDRLAADLLAMVRGEPLSSPPSEEITPPTATLEAATPQ